MDARPVRKRKVSNLFAIIGAVFGLMASIILTRLNLHMLLGEKRHISLITFPLFFGIIGYLLASNRQKVLALTYSTQYTMGIIKTMQDPVIVLNPEGFIRTVNPAVGVLLGYTEEELFNQHFSKIRGQTNLSMDQFLEAKHNDKHGVLISKDGTPKTVLISTAVLKNDFSGHTHIIVNAKDISALIKEQNHQTEISRVTAHQSGMAEIATGILHNVGNILNSVNVSVEMLKRVITTASYKSLIKANELLKENLNDIPTFFTNDPKGKLLPQYYIQLGEVMNTDYMTLAFEVAELQKSIGLIKDVINSQQMHARGGEFKEEIFITDVIESTIAMQNSALVRHDIFVIRKFSNTHIVMAQKAKLIHVLLNLIKNAKEAMISKTADRKELTIETGKEGDHAFIKISDNGLGVAKENLTKIFNHGFTTKKEGHGFGLHYCANAITEMGGKISIDSPGLNQGATFKILLPKKETLLKAG
jgi:PAS domain S-box-containing protein